MLLKEDEVRSLFMKHGGVAVRYGTKDIQFVDDSKRVRNAGLFEGIIGSNHCAVISHENESGYFHDRSIEAVAHSISEVVMVVTSIEALDRLVTEWVLKLRRNGKLDY